MNWEILFQATPPSVPYVNLFRALISKLEHQILK